MVRVGLEKGRKFMRTEGQVVPLDDEPLTCVLRLPEGCTPGRFEAAEAFQEACGELKRLYPGKRFQLLPFSYNTDRGENPALACILAIEEGERT